MLSFCNGDEENGRHACMNGHLTTADQSEIREAYLVSVVIYWILLIRWRRLCVTREKRQVCASAAAIRLGHALSMIFWMRQNRNAVIKGRGIAIFSKRVVLKECEEGEIVILPLKGVEITRNINMVIHKNKYMSESMEMIKEILEGGTYDGHKK